MSSGDINVLGESPQEPERELEVSAPASLFPKAQGPQGPENPYRAQLLEQVESTQTGLLQSLGVALQGDPDMVAEAQRLGIETGTDPRWVENNLDAMRDFLQRKQLELWRLSGSDPVLRAQMLDPAFARQAHDDIPNLSVLEQLASDLLVGGYNAKSAWDQGVIQSQAARLHTERRDLRLFHGADAELPAEDLERLQALERRLREMNVPERWFTPAVRIAGGMRDTGANVLKAAFAGGAAGALIPIPGAPLITALAAGIATLASESYAIEGGLLYKALLDGGVDEEKAIWLSMGGGLASASLEVLGELALGAGFSAGTQAIRRAVMKEAVGRAAALTRPTVTRGGVQFAKNYLMGLTGETATEGLQELVTITTTNIGQALSGVEMDLSTATGRMRAGRQLGAVLAETAQGMALLAIPGPTLSYVAEMGRVGRARQQGELFQRWVDRAAKSKLRQRNPDALEELLDEATQEQETFIAGERFAEALEQSGMTREELRRDLPEIDRQLDGAVETKGDVVIRSSTYAAKVAPTPLGSVLMQDVRVGSPYEYSTRDADAVMSLADELEGEAIQDLDAVESFAQSGWKVQSGVIRQLLATGRFGDLDARAASRLYRVFVDRWSKELGITPEAFVERYPLTVRGPQAGALSPEALQQLATDTPEFKRWFGESKIVDDEGNPLELGHGTATHFEEFSLEKARDEEGRARRMGWGADKFYFGPKEAVGVQAEYAVQQGKGEAPQVMPVYLSVQKPIEAAEYQARVLEKERELSDGPDARDRAIEAVDAEIQADGYDGIVDPVSGGVAVFSPEQIKSTSNRGTFDPNDPNVLRQDRPAFFSALIREVGKLDTRASTAKGWRGAIQGLVNKGKVKADELYWSGLYDWLDMLEGKIAKEDVLEYLRGNAVKVRKLERVSAQAVQDAIESVEIPEIENSIAAARAEWRDYRRELEDKYAEELQEDVLDQLADPTELEILEELWQNVARGHERLAEARDRLEGASRREPRYGEYTLPGGENYREILVTLPNATRMVRPDPSQQANIDLLRAEEQQLNIDYRKKIELLYEEMRVSGVSMPTTFAADLGRELALGNELPPAWRELPQGVRDRMLELGHARLTLDSVREQLEAAYKAQEKPLFASPHWSDPNVLAHIRVTDRLTADGRKVLFVEEIQSDWAQKGRAEGFRPEGEERVAADRSVPRAPFVESTKGWLDLALKQVMLEAVEGGYDAVAFASGEQSADRYNLSRAVYNIEVGVPDADGEFWVTLNLKGRATPSYVTFAVDRDGEVGEATRAELDGNKLSDVVGKEMAERIVGTAQARLGEASRWEILQSPEDVAADEGALTYSIVDENGEWLRGWDGEILYWDNYADAETALKEQAAASSENDGIIAGEGLKVGGAGMIAFYDQIVPNTLRKLGKKFGVRTGAVDIAIPSAVTGGEHIIQRTDEGFAVYRHGAEVGGEPRGVWGTYHEARDWVREELNGSLVLADEYGVEATDGGWNVVDGNGVVVQFHENSAIAQLQVDALNQEESEAIEDAVPGAPEGKQFGFEVTEELRETATKDGLPLFQRGADEVRGQYDPDIGAILLTEHSDPSTFLHELAHHFLVVMADIARAEDAPAFLARDMQALLDWFGVESLEEWHAMPLAKQRKSHETFALGFESYLGDGRAPTLELQDLFDRFAGWLRDVYGVIRDELNAIFRRAFKRDLPALTPEVREVFDRMLASEKAVGQTEAVRSMVPAFETQEQSGMTDAEWEDYQRGPRRAKEAAIREVMRASLDARTRARELEQATLGGRLRAEAEAEVRRRPVYRAIRFLRHGEYTTVDGELVEGDGPHRMSGDAVRLILGMPRRERVRGRGRPRSMITAIRKLGGISRESWDTTYPGETTGEFRIRGVVTRDGMTWEEMAEALQQEGYGPQGVTEAGAADYGWFVDAMADEASGVPTYREQDYEGFMSEEDMAGVEPTPPEVLEERERERAESRRKLMRLGYGPHGMLVKEGGLEPDFVAEMFGFDGGGKALIETILSAPKEEDAIAEAALELAGQGAMGQDMRAEVDAAIHNDVRAAYVAAELLAMTRANQPHRIMVAAAREAARRRLLSTPVREIKPWRYAAAERRANMAAHEAAKRADTAEAIEQKRAELLNHEMAREARIIEQDVERAEGRWRRFSRPDKRLAESRDIDFIRAGRALLAAVGAMPTVVEAQQTELRDEAIERLAAEHPGLHARMLSAQVAAAGRSYRSLPLDVFRSVEETTRALWDLSRSSKQLEEAGEAASVAVASAELQTAIAKRPKRLAPLSKSPDTATPTLLHRGALKAWNMWAGLKRLMQWVKFMDNDNHDGAFHRYILLPIIRRVDAYREAKFAAIRKMHEPLMALAEKAGPAWDAWIETKPEEGMPGRSGRPFRFRGLKEVLGALAHAGTHSNLRKLLVGRGWAPDPRETNGVLDTAGWDRFLQRMFDEGLLGPEEVDFVQSIWDIYAGFLPMAQRAHRSIFGFEFEQLELRELQTPWRVYKGGYSPARADPDELEARRPDTAIESLMGLEQEFQYSISTGRGFTLSRNPNYNKPLNIDIGRHIGHFDEELRFIHIQPAIRNVIKLLRDRDFKSALDAYDREAATGIILPWLENVARQATSKPSDWPLIDQVGRFIRAAGGMAALGLNFTNAALQLTGLFNAMTLVKGRYMRAGLNHWRKNPVAAVREASEKSIRFREVVDLTVTRMQQDIQRLTRASRGARAWTWLQQEGGNFAYFPQRILQGGIVNPITWHGAYQQAIVEAPEGLSLEEVEKRAVEFADLALERSQGSNNPESLAAYEVASPLWRLFTQFGSYSNAVLNQITSSPKGPGQAASAMALTIAAVAAGEGAIRVVLGGEVDDEDGDGYLDDLAFFYGKMLARQAAGLIPVAGPAFMALAESEGTRLNAMPGITAVQAAARGFVAIADLVSGEEVTGYQARAIGSFLTTTLGVPLMPLGRTAGYATDVSSGRVTPTSTYDYVRGLIIGRASDASR